MRNPVPYVWRAMNRGFSCVRTSTPRNCKITRTEKKQSYIYYQKSKFKQVCNCLLLRQTSKSSSSNKKVRRGVLIKTTPFSLSLSFISTCLKTFYGGRLTQARFGRTQSLHGVILESFDAFLLGFQNLPLQQYQENYRIQRQSLFSVLCQNLQGYYRYTASSLQCTLQVYQLETPGLP